MYRYLTTLEIKMIFALLQYIRVGQGKGKLISPSSVMRDYKLSRYKANKYLSELKKNGLISRRGNLYLLTPVGYDVCVAMFGGGYNA
jgi:predicted transcriptional regulator